MEASSSSSTHAQSEKKKPKVCFKTKIFTTAIKAVQVQTIPSADSLRKKAPRVAGRDSFYRPTESRSETDVLNTVSCNVDETGKSLEKAETSRGSESQDPQGKAESCLVPVVVNPLVKKEGDCKEVDSHGFRVQSDSTPDKVVDVLNPVDNDRVAIQTDQAITGSVSEKPMEKADPSRSVDQDHVDQRKRGSVQIMRSADQVPSIDHGEDRGDLDPENKDCRSSEPGSKDRGARVEQQNKNRRSIGRGRRMQNDKGRDRSSDHVKKEQQTKSRSLDTQKSDQQRKDHQSSERKKVEQFSKASRSSDHEKVEQPSKVSQSLVHENVEQPSKACRSLDHEKVEQPSKVPQSLVHVKVQQPSKAPRSLDHEKVEQPSKASRSLDHEKVEQPSKAPRSLDHVKAEPPNKDHQSSDHENIQLPNEVRSSDHEKTLQSSADNRSVDCERGERQSKDYPSYRKRSSYFRYPGSYGNTVDEEPQQGTLGGHRGHGQQRGRGRGKYHREHLYHYSKIPRDKTPQNTNYGHDDVEKPRKLSKERLGKNCPLQREEEWVITSSGDVTEGEGRPKTGNLCGSSTSRGGRKSRRGAGALGLGYSRQLGSKESVKTETSNEADVEKSNWGRGRSRIKPLVDCNRHLGSRESVKTETLNEADVEKSNRGRGRSTVKHLLDFNQHLGSRESVKTETLNEADVEKSNRGRGRSTVKHLLDFNHHLGRRESVKTDRPNDADIENSTADCKDQGSSTTKPLMDFNRILGSRESVRSGRSYEAETGNSARISRGRGKSTTKPLLDYRRRPEHRSPGRETGEHKSPARRTGKHRSPRRTGEHRSPQRTGEHRSPRRTGEHRSARRTSEHKSPQKAGEHRSSQRTREHKSPRTEEHKSPQRTGEHRSSVRTGEHRSPQRTGEHRSTRRTEEQKSSQRTGEHISTRRTGEHRSLRRTGEHRSPRRTVEHKTEKNSEHCGADVPDKLPGARGHLAEHSDEQGLLVYNRGRRRKSSRGSGYSSRGVENFGGQNRRVSSHESDSGRISTSIDENRKITESLRGKGRGRGARCAQAKSVTPGVDPKNSSGFSTHSSKQDSCDDLTKDKELHRTYDSRLQSKDEEKSDPRYRRPVAAKGGEENPGRGLDEARRHGDRTELSKRNDGVPRSGLLTDHSNTLRINATELTNTSLRNGVSSRADDVDSLCSVFSALGNSVVTAPSSVSLATMDVPPLQTLPSPYASVACVPLPTDGGATPVYNGIDQQEVPRLDSQGLATDARNSTEPMNVSDLPPPLRPNPWGRVDRPRDPRIRKPIRQYPDGQQQRSPHGLSAPPCSSPPYWNNSPGAYPQFGTPPNTEGLRRSVRPSSGKPPPGSSRHGYGSGRFVHTSPVRPYQPPEPMSPAPDPRALMQAAFQEGSDQMETCQVTPEGYLSPFQLQPAVPSPTAENWGQAATTQGYESNPPIQPIKAEAASPQEVPQMTPSLNISRKDYQHWVECYIKARETYDDASVKWCRYYWYVAVYLPSVTPQGDAENGPAQPGILDTDGSPAEVVKVEPGGSDPPQGSEVIQTGTPVGNPVQQMCCSPWRPLDQEASGESGTPLECPDQKPNVGSCPSDNLPPAFGGMSVKTWKGSGNGDERVRMRCKRLSYADLEKADAAAKSDGSPAKVVKMFKVERATDQESVNISPKPLSFRMNPPHFPRSSENQFFRAWGRGRNTEGRGDETARTKFQVVRRNFGSASSEAVASPVSFVAPDWMDWKTQFKRLTESATVPYIDSHCHLDLLYRRASFQGTFKDFRSLQAETFPSNFFGCVAIFCNPLSWSSYLLEDSLFKSLLSEENIWAAVGCHPKSALDFNARTEMNLRQLLKHDRVKALGEVGLDYSGNYAQHREVQLDVLQRQVTTALKLNKPLVIHARDAENEIGEVLEKLVPRHYKIHRHCFLGSWSEAEAWLEKFPNSYIGLTPAVTHLKYHSHLRELLWHLPLEKLLLETDTPYFIPSQIPMSEMSLSHPGLAITVALEVANVKQLPVNDVLTACLRNTRYMYDL